MDRFIAKKLGDAFNVIEEGLSGRTTVLDQDERVPGTQEKYKGAEEKSKQLGEYYQKVAEKYNCEFIDIAQYIKSSKHDGYHLEPEAHAKISDVLEEKIGIWVEAIGMRLDC